MKNTKPQKLIEFKGSTVPVIIITVRSLEAQALRHEAQKIFGDSDFFDGDAGLIDLSQVGDADAVDWKVIQECFSGKGLKLIGVRGGSASLQKSALAAQLAVFPSDGRARSETPAVAPDDDSPVAQSPAAQGSGAGQQAAASEPPAPLAAAVPEARTTMVVDRPLRSGQRVYARGGDLVVLAAVNAGSEVIADGNIHVYAPLRGRALAGASGDHDARIFSTRFEPELISVAGVYRTFETGVPEHLAGQAVHVSLDADGNTLLLETMKLD